MPHFEFYLHDRRITLPERSAVEAADLEQARRLAQATLDDSPDLVGIEIRQGGQLMALVPRFPT